MTKFVNVRALKNQTTTLLHEVEKGTNLVVTRRGKPCAIVKAFDMNELEQDRSRLPTTAYDFLRAQIQNRHPELKRYSQEKHEREFERITRKVKRGLPYDHWQQMDRAVKGVRDDSHR
jgi:antitoxin (DNA-binding transcriptional repressor) of toxin-antitoxin stability system